MWLIRGGYQKWLTQHGYSMKFYESGVYKEKQKYTNIHSTKMYTELDRNDRNDCTWRYI